MLLYTNHALFIPMIHTKAEHIFWVLFASLRLVDCKVPMGNEGLSTFSTMKRYFACLKSVFEKLHFKIEQILLQLDFSIYSS